MKKVVKIVFCILLFMVVGCKNKMFSLDEKYYKEASLNEIQYKELNKLIDNKESFGVFIYQPLCETSSGFESVLNNFIKQYQMSFYKVAYSDIKNIDLGKKIKYYPSFIIYKEGEIVDYLEADKDEDTNIYKNIEDFKSWLSSYVTLPNITNSYEENENTNLKDFNITVEVDDISYDENKVNIYLFWGDGCPHCENAKSFFESIEEEYGKYFKLNKFEVWYDKDNKEIMNQFASAMGEEVKGVPYIIIGNKTYKGFSSSYKESIVGSITSQYKNSYDVYFNRR